MTCRGRFYVVGPPVQSAHAVEDLVSYVMRETPGLKTANFVLNDLEGPVRYDSTWVPGGRQQEIRYGPGVAELWTGLVLWLDARSARSFTVIVMDEKYRKDFTGHRYMLPKFETFVVAVLHLRHDVSLALLRRRTMQTPLFSLDACSGASAVGGNRQSSIPRTGKI